MAGMASSCKGKTTGDEGNCDVIYSPYPQSSPLPLRLTYLFQHFGLDKIHAIMNSSDGKTFEQKIDQLREEMSAFERARDVFSMVEVEDGDEDDEDDEEDDVDVDEADRKAGKLLDDEKKPDITKRPHAPIEDELEYKKPKIAEGLGCQGEEPEAGGIKNSSW